MSRDSNGGYTHWGLRLEPHMVAALDRYINKHILPGDFLQAVICNNLTQACGRADETNVKVLPAFAAFMYNEAPSHCWGSRETLKTWVNIPIKRALWEKFETRCNDLDLDEDVLDEFIQDLQDQDDLDKQAKQAKQAKQDDQDILNANLGLKEQFNLLFDRRGASWVKHNLIKGKLPL